MTASFEQSVADLVGIIEASRPPPGMVDSFLHDFANLTENQRVILNTPISEGMGCIYLDLYGKKIDPAHWNMSEYVSVVLAHRHTHCYFETVKDLKEKDAPVPEIVHKVVNTLSALAPLPRQETFNETVESLAGLTLALDFIRSRDFDQSRDQRKKLNHVVEGLFESLSGIFPDFQSLAATSYRNLGYFELNPFSKRITVDAWIKVCAEEVVKGIPGVIGRGLYAESISWILGTIFGPKLEKLSRSERMVIDALLRNDVRMREEEIADTISISGQPENLSSMRQGLARLIDLKAVSEQDGVYRVRGDEFADWYRATQSSRRARQTLSLRIAPRLLKPTQE